MFAQIHEESFCEETYSVYKQEMNRIRTNDSKFQYFSFSLNGCRM